MNKELELEAENYGWRIKRNEFSDPVKANELAKSASHDFIAGATSKYVEKQKLEFAIEQLNELEFNPKEHIVDFVLHIKNKIKKLKQNLSEL